MPDSPRQPPEQICDHFNWKAWMAPGKGKPKCKAGVEYRSVSHGLPANFCIGTVPCYGMCGEATCDERVLPVVKPVVKPVKQPTLF